jgi:CheY-like chemotaxis protein
VARVVVVDDVEFILQMLAEFFRDQGHEVFPCSDGAAALETARRERPDLILLDIAMPGMDGIEVARRLRADPATHAVKILMVTSRSDPKSIARATEAGADGHVAKPFDTDVLLANAAELLGTRMSFSVDRTEGGVVVTVLKSTVGADGIGELESALDEARAAKGVIGLDLSRVSRVEQAASDALVRCTDELRKAGRTVHAVQPAKGIGTRTLTVRLEPHAGVHDTLSNALRSAGVAAPEPPERAPSDAPASAPAASAVPPSAPATAAPAPTTGPTCIVESLGKVAMVRVRRAQLADALPDVRAGVLPLGRQNVVLNLKGIVSITQHDAGELSSLTEELRAGGRTLRLIHAEPAVIESLTAEGLGELVVEDSATRASSRR